MAILQVKTLTDGTTAYDHRATIEGTEYLLTFLWNDRRERWAFSIAALDGTPIIT